MHAFANRLLAGYAVAVGQDDFALHAKAKVTGKILGVRRVQVQRVAIFVVALE
jgi:hypothetical protein